MSVSDYIDLGFSQHCDFPAKTNSSKKGMFTNVLGDLIASFDDIYMAVAIGPGPGVHQSSYSSGHEHLSEFCLTLILTQSICAILSR